MNFFFEHHCPWGKNNKCGYEKTEEAFYNFFFFLKVVKTAKKRKKYPCRFFKKYAVSFSHLYCWWIYTSLPFSLSMFFPLCLN